MLLVYSLHLPALEDGAPGWKILTSQSVLSRLLQSPRAPMSSFDWSPSLSLGISGGSMVTSLQTSLRISASVSLKLLCLRTENPPFMQDRAWSTLLLFPKTHNFGIPCTYLRQRSSWKSLLFITNPRLAIGRVVSHDDVPFADWCCRIEVKAEFLLSAACRNVDSAFFLFDTTDFAAYNCAWMLVSWLS